MKTLKKTILALLILTTIFSVVACSSGIKNTDNNDYDEVDKESNLAATEKINDDTIPATNKPVSTPSAYEIDPFDGLTLSYAGISPFCTVAINNSKCSKDAQKYVEYSIDGDYFANGDTVTVTATIDNNIDNYAIKSGCETKAFTVSDMPYYVESLDGLDISELEKELNDYVTSQISFESSAKLFDISNHTFLNTYVKENAWYTINNGHFYNVESVNSKEAHILTLKERNKDSFIEKETKIYNSLRILSTCTAEASLKGSNASTRDGKGDIYVCFNIDNLIAYPDGKLGWGLSSPESFEFTYKSTLGGTENVKASNVTAFSSDYNINSVSKTDWIDIKK